MNTFKQQCIELRKKDYTLGEIVKITGKPKTSVYAHIRYIPLSPEKIAAVKAAHRIRALHIAAQRRGRSTRTYRPFSSWDNSMICLVAHLLFDGTLERRSCVYNNRSTALLERVAACMLSMYPYQPSRSFNNETGVHRISYHNVTLGPYLIEKASLLLRDIKYMDKEFQREFLRAFFDDEGCIDFRKARNVRQVRGYQKNTDILRIIKELLIQFDIDSRIALPNEVVISGKEHLIKFQKEINFSPGVRINGARSNSIWKESLEKRELLARAIVSYKK